MTMPDKSLDEAELLGNEPLDADGKALLDREFEEFQANPNAGAEWKEIESCLRQQIQQ